MITHYSFFLFLVIFVMISFTTVYADLYFGNDTIDYATNLGCYDEYVERLATYPDAPTVICTYKVWCENYFYSSASDRAALAENYIVQQYLHKNSLSLDVAHGYPPALDDIYGGTWNLQWDGLYPLLKISFDVCSNVEQYDYYESANSTHHLIRYPNYEWSHPEKVLVFEKESYDLAKLIMQRHPAPAIQMSEFNIQPNEIHCNDGLELYIRENAIPVCLKSQTYEALLERDFIIQFIIPIPPSPAIQMSEFNIQPNEIHCNDGLELYIRENNTPVCLKSQTYEKMLERGL